MLDKEKLKKICKQADSKNDFAAKLEIPNPKSGNAWRKVTNLIKEYNLDISHFDKGVERNRKHKIENKVCPICKKKFQTGYSGKYKTTCSNSCANSFFKSGDKNPNWKKSAYRSTCFLHHKKECIVCKEDKIVDVHHVDENKNNNCPTNLVPLCPTHHKYFHSRYKALVENIVAEYVENFKKEYYD